jgi:inosine-uridine nucleoside N-ribohydrolase
MSLVSPTPSEAPSVVVALSAFPHDLLGLLALAKSSSAVMVRAVVLTPLGAWDSIAKELVAKVIAFAWAGRQDAAPKLFVVDVAPDAPQRKRAETLEIMCRKHSLDLQCLAGLCTPPVVRDATVVAASAKTGSVGDVAEALAKSLSGRPVTLLVASGHCGFANALLAAAPDAVASLVVCGGITAEDAAVHGLPHGTGTGAARACPGFYADPAAAAALLSQGAKPVTLWPLSVTNSYRVSEERVRDLAAVTDADSAPWPTQEAQLEAALWASFTPLNHAEFGGRGGGLGCMPAVMALSKGIVAQHQPATVTVDADTGCFSTANAAISEALPTVEVVVAFEHGGIGVMCFGERQGGQ